MSSLNSKLKENLELMKPHYFYINKVNMQIPAYRLMSETSNVKFYEIESIMFKHFQPILSNYAVDEDDYKILSSKIKKIS